MIRKSVAVCAEACSCVRGFEDLKGFAAECTDQNCGFSKELNKAQFCGCSPYTRGEPHYILCRGSVCCFIVFSHALISIYLISKDHC